MVLFERKGGGGAANAVTHGGAHGGHAVSGQSNNQENPHLFSPS